MAYGKAILDSPFGEESRAFILARYFHEHPEITPANAWEHVYRLLLWVDVTTSLAHCYESDKSQPGRHWYGRSLAFHTFVADRLGVAPLRLHEHIDTMFKLATTILAEGMVEEVKRRAERAVEQRAPYGDRLPVAGAASEVAAEVEAALVGHYGEVTPELVGRVVRLVTESVSLENKRKNLVGEGFEDTLAEAVRRIDSSGGLTTYRRRFLHEIPGFRKPAKNEKDRRVDLCFVHNETGHRTIASAKWSLRADREEQFGADYDFYRRQEESGEGFDFVLITNEFDAARLVAACTRRIDAVPVFKRVVHMQPDGLGVVHPTPQKRSKGNDLATHRASGKLASFGEFVEALTTPGGRA